MKLVWFGAAVSIAAAIAVIAHFAMISRDLSAFCQSLHPGMAISEVRDEATEHGYNPRMDPYLQISIEPTGWHYARPTCKVFFNKDHELEYRVWQGR